MEKIFITGANGFVGHHLVNYLGSKKYNIFALIRRNSIPFFKLKKNVRVISGDLLDYSSLEKSIPQGAIVVNLAANPYHPILSYKVNVTGTKNLIRAAQNKKVKKIIHISSQATKIKVKGVYAKTKHQSDIVVSKSGIKYTILKPSLIYGPGEKGLFNRIKALVSSIPFIPVFGNGKTKLNPIHVDDLSKLIEYTIKDQKISNETYDIGSKKAVTYNKLYRLIVKYLNKKAFLVHIPVKIGILLGHVFSKLKNPPFYIDNVLGSTQESNCNPVPILKKYNFKPITLKEGLEKTIAGNKLKVAVAGLGRMGLVHLSILSTFSNIRIVALIDKNKQAFATIKSIGISGNFYQTLDEAIKSEKIDALYILTPTFAHFGLLKKALKRNINVFIEKPVSLNANQIEKLKKVRTNSIVCVGYTLLFNRVFSKVNEIIAKGKYGKILSFEANFKHGEVLKTKNGWMFNKKTAGGGVLMNPGPHLFSLINFFFGKPKEIRGQMKKIYSKEVEDQAEMVLDYGSYKGNVSLSWSVKNQLLPKNSIKIVFEKALLSADGEKIEIKTGKKKLIIRKKEIKTILQPIFNINPQAHGEEYYIENKLFIQSLEDKRIKNNLNNLKFALETESIIFKCYKSCLKV